MFIQIGEKRLNLNIITDYKPVEKYTVAGKKNYSIKFRFMDKSEEELHFFEKKDDRDVLIEKLDKNLL